MLMSKNKNKNSNRYVYRFVTSGNGQELFERISSQVLTHRCQVCCNPVQLALSIFSIDLSPAVCCLSFFKEHLHEN